MFQLYLLLRLKNFGRIVIELGIFRIVFLTILTVAAIMILFLAENRLGLRLRRIDRGFAEAYH